MAFDFKKEYKNLYMPGKAPVIVDVPKANFLAISGQGDPNEKDGSYNTALNALYAVAYTLRMSYKSERKIAGYYEYVVPPLEGLWRNKSGIVSGQLDKSSFCWTSLLRLPDFISKDDFVWALEAAAKKKKLDTSKVEFFTFEEGLCVQVMHTGSYDDEPATLALMDSFLAENGYENDITDTRLHHEIYISDPNKTPPEKMKTVIRHPVKKAT